MHISESIRRHYKIRDLVAHMNTALQGVDESADSQMEVDQFHVMGLEGTVELAERLSIRPDHRFLDIGCGFGGPARYVSHQTAAAVVGLDQAEGYAESARWLAERARVRAEFIRADAVHIPLADRSFDRIWMLHVGMNVPDKASLFAEVRRLLRPGGRFLIFDFVRGDGEPNYPLPWAREVAGSHLVSSRELDELLAAAGFRPQTSEDWSERALEWLRKVRHRTRETPNLVSLVFREDAKAITTNLDAGLGNGALRLVLRIVSE